MIPPEFLQAVVDQTSIADVVGRHVRLKPRGQELFGLCPFHAERSPSFTVRPSKKFFYCFGCGAHGNVINFAMRADGMAFPDAVQRLAAEIGLSTGEGLRPIDRAELERQRERMQKERESADAEATVKREQAMTIWRDGWSIEGTPAETYLVARGLNPEQMMAEPAGWPETLRWSNDAMPDPEKPPRGALVVAVNDARTGLVRGIQRIFLNPDGSPVIWRGKKVKLSLGDIEGNAAMFSGAIDPQGRWGIGEGGETSLAATQLYQIPVWAAISSGNLPNVMPPAWAKHAIVFADADDGGIIAADEARKIYETIPGIETVQVIAATERGLDVADFAQRTA